MLKTKTTFLQLLPLFLSIFIDSLGWGVVFPIFAVITLDNAIQLFPATTSLLSRNMWYEVLIALYCLFMFFGSPLLGSFSDRYGRKKVILISLLGTGAGFLLGALGIYAKSLLFIILGRIIAGGTAGNFPIIQAAVADLSTEETLPKNFGLIALANGVGFACGPVIGAFFLDPKWWHPVHYILPFLSCAGLIFLTAIFLTITFKDVYVGNPEQKIDWKTGFFNMRDAFTFASVRTYFIVLLLFFVGYTLFFCNLPIFLQEHFHKNAEQIGYVLTYFAVFFSASLLFLLPRLTKKYSLQRLTLFSLAVQMIGYLLFIFSHSFALALLILLPVSLMVPFTFVTQISLISENTDALSQGKMMGVTGSVMAFSWGVGPIFTAYLMKAGTGWVYAISEVLLAFAFLVLFFHSKPPR